jgi:uncharacterized protein YndB with AHSA1/START domain
MSKFVIEKSIEINAPVSTVWRVFTDPALTRKLGGEYVSDWKVGSAFGWKSLDGTMLTKGTVLNIGPEKLLQHALLNSVGPIDSVVTYEFDENEGATTVHAQEEFANPISDKEYRDAAQAWDAALRLLKDTAERQKR